MSEIDDLTQEFKVALQVNSQNDRFDSLSQFIEHTDSSSLPTAIKNRFIDKAKEHQDGIIDTLLKNEVVEDN